MSESSSALIKVAVLLGLLATAALAGLVLPKWRGIFHWGRGSDSYPISRLGCLGLALGLAMMACAVAGSGLRFLPAGVDVLVLLGGFCVFIVAGLVDRHAQGPRS